MELKNEVRRFLDLCHLLHEKDLVSGPGGNVSFRCGSQVMITPSGRRLESLKEEDVVFLSADGSFTSQNGGKPSKEWRMHLSCYSRNDIGAIIHVHSVYAMAVSCLKNLDRLCAIPVYTPGYGTRVGKLPVIPYELPGSVELADKVAAVIEKRNSVMMANHGVLTVGKTPEDALNLVEEIEEASKMYFALADQGRPLTEEQQTQLFPMGLRQ